MVRPSKTSYGPEKPALSYVFLCKEAIESSPTKKLPLSSIYNYIMNKYPYFRENISKWQNSLRHNLSNNDCFIKVPRDPHDTGKGQAWALHPDSDRMFENGSCLRRRLKFKAKERLTSINSHSKKLQLKKKLKSHELNFGIDRILNSSDDYETESEKTGGSSVTSIESFNDRLRELSRSPMTPPHTEHPNPIYYNPFVFNQQIPPMLPSIINRLYPVPNQFNILPYLPYIYRQIPPVFRPF